MVFILVNPNTFFKYTLPLGCDIDTKIENTLYKFCLMARKKVTANISESEHYTEHDIMGSNTLRFNTQHVFLKHCTYDSIKMKTDAWPCNGNCRHTDFTIVSYYFKILTSYGKY